MHKYLQSALLLLFFCGNIYSQEDSLSQKHLETWPVEFNEAEIEELKTSPEFEYLDRETSTSWWSQFKAWVNAKFNEFIDWLFGSYEPGSFLGIFIEILPYLLLFLVLGLAGWLFVRLNPAYSSYKNQEMPKVFFSEEEKIIRSQDIGELLETARKEENYKLAVRYYYLKNLQELDRKEIINYKTEKTNADYRAEIPSENLGNQFSKITRIYEFIWYGDFKVSEEDFQLAENAFLRMEKLLNQNKNV